MATETTGTRRPTTAATPTVTPVTGIVRLPVWLCAVQIVLGYEWIISGLNKLLDATFVSGLPKQLPQGAKDNPYQWHVHFLQRVVSPHTAFFGVLVEWAETLVGVTLLVGALLWLVQPRSRVTTVVAWASCAALVGAALMALNYFFQGATALPWIDTAQAYHPAVDIGILVPLLSFALLGANAQVLGRRRGHRLVDPDTGYLRLGHAGQA